jgi:hypothetical protein
MFQIDVPEKTEKPICPYFRAGKRKIHFDSYGG